MDRRVRIADANDVPTLAALMVEFYRESGYTLSSDAAARAFMALRSEPGRGRVWLMELDAQPVGYIVLTVAFSMEYGGLRGFVDDFFVRPAFRNQGVGAAALRTVRDAGAELGLSALVVETGPETHPARGVYARAGFADEGRVLLAQALAPALHEA